ncbi:unnamed protein product [Enterobius vermicularis]|uniref:Neuropeptide CCHamide-1 n=1 Tax=Enterobius vermicularis TaxID=51028 RepID=A0A0N4USL5_ENTVE|nr:unnamed protein product [Enterobius vermicularis]
MDFKLLLLIIQISFIESYLCGCGSCRGVNGKACARCCTGYVKRSHVNLPWKIWESPQLNDRIASSTEYDGYWEPAYADPNFKSEKTVQQLPRYYRNWWSYSTLREKRIQKSLIEILGLRRTYDDY